MDFSDAERTAFHVSPQTAEVETRRSAVWRLYDFTRDAGVTLDSTGSRLSPG